MLCFSGVKTASNEERIRSVMRQKAANAVHDASDCPLRLSLHSDLVSKVKTRYQKGLTDAVLGVQHLRNHADGDLVDSLSFEVLSDAR